MFYFRLGNFLNKLCYNFQFLNYNFLFATFKALYSFVTSFIILSSHLLNGICIHHYLELIIILVRNINTDRKQEETTEQKFSIKPNNLPNGTMFKKSSKILSCSGEVGVEDFLASLSQGVHMVS